MRVSVLDTSPIVEGSTAREALRRTVDLAVLAEDLGYHRYWVPEHHGMRGVASSAPAVVVGQIAAETSRIRVGAGGVLLPNHAPIVVAEQFGTLAAFHPGRIDLGLGRAPGGPRAAVAAVRGSADRAAEPFAEQVKDLLAYFAGDRPVPAVPAIGNVPDVWVLGSSAAGARTAAGLGLPYAYAHHLNAREAVEALAEYRRITVRPTLLSVAVIAADTDVHAAWLAGPARLKALSRHRGRRILLPDPETAAVGLSDADPEEITAHSDHLVAGSPETVQDRLQGLLDRAGPHELMITTPVFDHADRRRSYELVAEVAQRLRPVHSH
ncbi:LLM class flavin-dependent oxidoreductase [Amycolatopsis rhabdoformis]|uniref:LLM class flavin-dependent oxidoreductase n=1 Tax=Amycolatopsis rhabdoformis TaxID=1448059 RepID=A0ABZ1IF30_9PSEU|nr:LLM class flavin-dependent oxidoreductase [Amycolatopsis rhabdoformis]WSE32709.1 LLM class flavin-dependent oxidoreductase [Amycolatopsis rhabdoformis]